MKIYTAKYMKVTATTYDRDDRDYTYAHFLLKRAEIISDIATLVKHGASCEKLINAFYLFFYNEHHLNISRELELKEDSNVIPCPYEDDDEMMCESDIWLNDFEVNSMFDVDFIIPEIVPATGGLFSLGWGCDRFTMKPVDVILDSVKDGTWGNIRRPEIYHAAANVVQEFYMDSGRSAKDVFSVIMDLRPLHQLMYFGDMADHAKDAAAKCKMPFDEFFVAKNVIRDVNSPEIVPQPDTREV